MCKEAGREKYWSEIDNTEKIERIRRAVKMQSDQLNGIERKIDKLIQHEHGAEGKVLVKFHDPSYPQAMSKRGAKNDDVFM